MKKYLSVLRACPLFYDIEDENLIPMLSCFGAAVKSYRKHETVFAEGDAVKSIGIVLSGEVQLERVDYDGNRSIVTTVYETHIFGESFACVGIEAIPVNIVATEESEIMLVDVRKITTPCCNACNFHSKIIFNLLKITAAKNLVYHQKLEITSMRSTREKLMTYLRLEAKKNHSNSFQIPYDRQELADYLEVDRSGLSAEIGKLRREGVLRSEKNRFTLFF